METQNQRDAGESVPDQRDLYRLRMTRLQDYLKESLSASDSLQANIGAEKSDVMLLALRLKEALDKARQRLVGYLRRLPKSTAAFQGVSEAEPVVASTGQARLAIGGCDAASHSRPVARGWSGTKIRKSGYLIPTNVAQSGGEAHLQVIRIGSGTSFARPP